MKQRKRKKTEKSELSFSELGKSSNSLIHIYVEILKEVSADRKRCK